MQAWAWDWQCWLTGLRNVVCNVLGKTLGIKNDKKFREPVQSLVWRWALLQRCSTPKLFLQILRNICGLCNLETFTGTQKCSKTVPGLNSILVVSSSKYDKFYDAFFFKVRFIPLYKFPEVCDCDTLVQTSLLNPKEVVFYSKLMFLILEVGVYIFCDKNQHVSCHIKSL